MAVGMGEQGEGRREEGEGRMGLGVWLKLEIWGGGVFSSRVFFFFLETIGGLERELVFDKCWTLSRFALWAFLTVFCPGGGGARRKANYWVKPARLYVFFFRPCRMGFGFPTFVPSFNPSLAPFRSLSKAFPSSPKFPPAPHVNLSLSFLS